MNHRGVRAGFARLSLALWLCLPGWAQAGDDKFDLLKTRTDVYTNVTVVSKTETDVHIFHAAGICNIKVSNLPPETLRQLGYTKGSDSDDSGSQSAVGESVAMQSELVTKELNAQLSAGLQKMRAAGGTVVIAFLAVFAVIYLFVCYCFSLICKKTGQEPGILVWLPILQIFPLLRAAGMSPLWFLAWLVPGLNLIAQIIWCFNITKAREKSAWVAVLLLLPVTNLIALLYLAFSDGASSNDEPIRTVPLVLETN